MALGKALQDWQYDFDAETGEGMFLHYVGGEEYEVVYSTDLTPSDSEAIEKKLHKLNMGDISILYFEDEGSVWSEIDDPNNLLPY